MDHGEMNISTINGIPCVIVDNGALWSLVEFLSLQRVHAQFTYSADKFCVTFPHHSLEGAQQFLNDWRAYANGTLHEAPHSAVENPLSPGGSLRENAPVRTER